MILILQMIPAFRRTIRLNESQIVPAGHLEQAGIFIRGYQSIGEKQGYRGKAGPEPSKLTPNSFDCMNLRRIDP
jgi:hypothetical protein